MGNIASKKKRWETSKVPEETDRLLTFLLFSYEPGWTTGLNIDWPVKSLAYLWLRRKKLISIRLHDMTFLQLVMTAETLGQRLTVIKYHLFSGYCCSQELWPVSLCTKITSTDFFCLKRKPWMLFDLLHLASPFLSIYSTSQHPIRTGQELSTV